MKKKPTTDNKTQPEYSGRWITGIMVCPDPGIGMCLVAMKHGTGIRDMLGFTVCSEISNPVLGEDGSQYHIGLGFWGPDEHWHILESRFSPERCTDDGGGFDEPAFSKTESEVDYWMPIRPIVAGEIVDQDELFPSEK